MARELNDAPSDSSAGSFGVPSSASLRFSQCSRCGSLCDLSDLPIAPSRWACIRNRLLGLVHGFHVLSERPAD